MKLGQIEEPNFGWRDMLRAIWNLIENMRKPYVFYNVVLFATLFYGLLPPFLVGKMIDFLASYKTTVSLAPFFAYVAILSIGQAGISFLRLTIKNEIGKLSKQLIYNIHVTGFERLLDFSLRWHDSENTGNKIQKIQNGTTTLNQFGNDLGNGVFPQTAAIIGVIIAYIFINPIFALISVAYVSTFIVIQTSFYKRMMGMNNEYNMLMERASGSYYEGLSNVMTIKTLGVKDDFKKNIVSKEELTRDYGIKITKFGTDKWKLFQIANGIGLGLILLLSGKEYLSHALSLGSIFVVFNYYSTLANGTNEWSSLFDRLVNYKSGIARMMPIFWDKSPVKEGNKKFPTSWEEIKLQNASFVYKQTNEQAVEQTREALKNITLNVKRHEKIGIVGKSGSGKSTLAKVLLGLYELDSGEYLIGDMSFYDMRHSEATKEVSLVLQDSEMFNLSLKDNITLMRRFDINLFTKAIQISQLEELIEKLPDGIETLIGEKGYRLSGGERQRIGIARAIYKDPQILVLDEATSSLDNKTEQLIQETIEKELSKKTIISIAHRVSTLRNVNRIIVFADGKIVEEGTFEELEKNKNSEFYKVYSHQKTAKN